MNNSPRRNHNSPRRNHISHHNFAKESFNRTMIPECNNYLIRPYKSVYIVTCYYGQKTGMIIHNCKNCEKCISKAVLYFAELNHHCRMKKPIIGFWEADFIENNVTIVFTFKL